MKRFLLLIILIFTTGICVFLGYKDKILNDISTISISNSKLSDKQKIKIIESHFSKYVIANKDTDILDSNNEKIGTIYKDALLELEDTNIKSDTKYFKIKNIGNVYYNDVNVSNDIENDYRYKNYIAFNKNLITKDKYTIYSKNGNKLYTLSGEKSYPILISNYDNKYYFEFNNSLVYINKSDIKKIIDKSNSKETPAKKITTLCYHRVFDKNDKCTNIQLCKSKSNFDREMKYLYDNKFFTLTTEEMYLFVSGKIRLPHNSVVITLDDGKLIKSAIEVLEKYNLHATTFLITSRVKSLDEYKSKSLEVQSHTHDMHTTGKCKTTYSYQQGGGILCFSEDTILNDLKKSKEILGSNTIALAYPFYDYNERAEKLLKKSGFLIAFKGTGTTKGVSTVGTNPYEVPRITMWNSHSLENFKSFVNN